MWHTNKGNIMQSTRVDEKISFQEKQEIELAIKNSLIVFGVTTPKLSNHI